MENLEIYKCFISSPGDCNAEREISEKVIDKLNNGIAKHLGLKFETFKWENDVLPDMGQNGQEIIDESVDKSNYDIFIGIMGYRFGTATKMATSSIIITTIAGEFYEGEESIFDTIENIISKIKQNFNIVDLVENRLKILNPVNSQEDFSDKWDDDKEPELYEHFKKFILHLDKQWKILKEENGIIEEANTIKGLFGEKAFLRAQDSQVNQLEKARKMKSIGINTSTGVLAESFVDSTKPIKSNTFFGSE